MMRLSRLFSLALLSLTVAAAIPAAAQEPLTLPEPGGNFAVSRVIYDLIDQNRDEVFTDDPTDRREILLTVYYPATPADGAARAPYMGAGLHELATSLFQLPEPLPEVAAYSTDRQPAAPGAFPLLVFSPGFGNLTGFYTSLLEHVASEGYVVAAIWHPYSTLAVEFPDGRLIVANES